MKPKQNPTVMIEELEGETLIYSAEGKAIHVLNPTAKVIWDLCDGAHDVDQIAQALRENFILPPDHDVKQDVQRTLEVFEEKGLLQTA